MELGDGYVWITTRKLKPGSREEFSRSWKPSEFPQGMLRAYELYSPDGNEVVGISVWDSAESRDTFRKSEVESERLRATSGDARGGTREFAGGAGVSGHARAHALGCAFGELPDLVGEPGDLLRD